MYRSIYAILLIGTDCYNQRALQTGESQEFQSK